MPSLVACLGRMALQIRQNVDINVMAFLEFIGLLDSRLEIVNAVLRRFGLIIFGRSLQNVFEGPYMGYRYKIEASFTV